MVFANKNQTSLGDVYGFASLAVEYKTTMTVEDFQAIFSSAGMDGQKYRAAFSKLVVSALEQVLGAKWVSFTVNQRRAVLTGTMVMIAMMLGISGSQRVLVKNMAGFMDTRSNKEDYMAVAYKIIEAHMVNYVSSATLTKMPSIKFASCHADLCFVGVCMLLSEVHSTTEVRDQFLDASGVVRPYTEWADCWKKQWVGNLNLDASFQTEHKEWSKDLWQDVIDSTNNENNKKFETDRTRRWKEEWYRKSEEDDLPLRAQDLSIITAPRNGYSKENFVNIAMIVTALFKATRTGTAGENALSATAFDTSYPAATTITETALAAFISVNSTLSRGVAGKPGLGP